MGEIGFGEQINLASSPTQGDMTVEESNKLEPVSQVLYLNCFSDSSDRTLLTFHTTSIPPSPICRIRLREDRSKDAY